MKQRKITIADVGEATGYNRDQLHGLLKKLPLYADYVGSMRVARTFTKHDVIVLCIAVRLEQKLGLRRAAVAAVIEHIHAELRIPRPSCLTPCLQISIDPPAVSYITEAQIEGEGTVVALGPLYQRVDEYLNGDSAVEELQNPLNFGLNLAVQRRQG